MKDYPKAIADLTEAIRLDPKPAAVFYSARGWAFRKAKEHGKAVADFTELIRLSPKADHAYVLRRMAQRSQRNHAQAIADYQEAIRINPKNNLPYTCLAWLWASSPDPKVRDGKKAVEYAQKACELSDWKDANDLENLAAGYAEVGNFAEAVKWQKQALEIAKGYSQESLEKARLRLKLFGEGKPYRDELEDE